MDLTTWFQEHFIEIFGAVTGILYVFLEIRQNLWLWPVGIITSAVYIWVFFVHKIYADMSLQVYYLVISVFGWYWWIHGRMKGKRENGGTGDLRVTRLKRKTGIVLAAFFVILYAAIWLVLSKLTDSPVPAWDAFITSLSVIATWMLARKIFEHWYLWIAVNAVSVILFLMRGLYPTMILYIIYGSLSFAGLVAWRKAMAKEQKIENITL